jgi:WD40 repeat protein
MSTSTRPVSFKWTTRLADFITSLAWSPDGTRLAFASVSGEVAIYDTATGRPGHVFEKAHEEGCDTLAWRPDGAALATAGRDGKWKLWDATTGRLMVEHEAGALWAEHLAWSGRPIGDKGHLLALGAGNKVSLWNEKGEASGEPLKYSRTIADVAWILGGGTLAAAYSTGVTVRDPDSDEPERTFQARDPILSMAFSPSGKWLMVGNQDCTIHIWNTDNGGEMHMRGYAAKVRQLAWHRGSRWLATGGSEQISIWDCSGRGPEGRTPALLEWHGDLISALHYQPQGDWLASGARDGGVAVWSPTQRQNFITGAKLPSGITRVAWSPDGSLLAAAGESGEVQVVAVD